MRCPGCGLSNFEGTVSCRRCGTTLTERSFITESVGPPPMGSFRPGPVGSVRPGPAHSAGPGSFHPAPLGSFHPEPAGSLRPASYHPPGSFHPGPVGSVRPPMGSGRSASTMPRSDYINPNAPSVVDDALDVPLRGLLLPGICSKCDATRDLGSRIERMSWTSVGTYVLAFVLAPLGLLFSIVALVLGQKSTTIDFPICPTCDARWRNAKIIRVVALFSPMVLGLVTASTASSADGNGLLVGLGVFLGTLVTLPVAVTLLVVRPATISARHIGARARLVGFSDGMRNAIARAPDPSVFLTNQETPSKSSWGTIVILIAVIGLPAIALLGVVSIYGVRRYIAAAKAHEARTSLGAIARKAEAVYKRDGRLCSSASAPVPEEPTLIAARKYQSTPADWQRDEGTGAGFACLGLSMTTPQNFQYDYQATHEGFTATARGDLNGDGVYSSYRIEGVIESGGLQLLPIEENNPLD